MNRVICVFCALLLSTATFSQRVSPTADMLDKVLGGVVTVAVYQTDAAMKPLGFRGPSDAAYAKVLDLGSAKGSGSGFIIQYGGKFYIVTNAHVVQEASSNEGSIYVYSISSKKYEAKIVGGDTFYDLAVLEFTGAPGAEITAVKFRTSDVRIGESVYAIGNPLGDYPYTVSDGIISAKNRVRNGLTGKFGFLQTTATVIWGNSGGPLVDANGDVVGINSQIAFTQMGDNPLWLPQINFALESGICQKLINDIFTNNGLIKRAYAGIELTKNVISPDKVKYYSYSGTTTDTDPSVIINNVVPGSPAENALGKYRGWKVETINGQEVRGVQEALGIFEKVQPGGIINFKLSRNGQTANASVTTEASNANANANIGRFALAKWGITSSQATDGIHLAFSDRRVYSSSQNKSTEMITDLGKNTNVSSDVLFDAEWLLVGAGILEDKNSQLWLVKDAADLGTVLRLCGTSGGVDIILFRRGSDPSVTSNYYRKRFFFSGNDDIFRNTLWY